jgi:hypothetical protein
MKVISYVKKRGMANVLGILFMVALLISAVIPLFLYVNQVNSYYDDTLNDMTHQDQIKADESLEVLAYPVGENFTMINVQVKNIGTTPVKVMRIWITEIVDQICQFWNESHISTLQDQIAPATQMTFQNLSLSSFGTDEMLLSVTLTTERGTVFSSQTNPIWISEGGWSGAYSFPYNIQFVFSSPKASGTWKIEGNIRVWYNQTVDPENLNITYYKVTTMDQLVQGNVYLESIGVPYEGVYHVIIDITTPQGNGEVFNDTIFITSYNPMRWTFIQLT